MESAIASHPAKTAEPCACARIGVIVPAYGVAHLVGEALESLQAQTLDDWECVVIDDGAPDDVAAAVEPFLDDPRIRFLATENQGVSGARNTAIAATSAPLVALLDGDDLFRPGYLAAMVEALDSDPHARFATCNARIFGAVPKERLCFAEKQGTGDGRHGSLADVLDRSFGVYIGSTFRRADFDAIGGFDTSMTHAEDFDFWVRLLLLGGHARYVDEVLGEYRVRSASASANDRLMLLGNIRVYEKALATLGDAPEEKLTRQLLALNQQALEFNAALERVIAGDVRAGLPQLRAASPHDLGTVWKLAFAVWSLAPQLAPPMLRWRQKSHSRGSSGERVPSLLQAQKAVGA
jgi:glycosyltransferase involved in cell wall biosynthesis